MDNNAKIKLFQNFKIRAEWDAGQGDWLFSAVDVCRALADSKSVDAGAYWRKLKQRLTEEGSETVTNCHELKLVSTDGKRYKTDCFYTEDILRLIQSVPSKKAEPFKLWLARVGRERIDEIADPELSINRAIENYRKKGYPESWINQRIKSIEIRKNLTDEWNRSGVHENREYAILTDEITKAWSGRNVREYKELKNLKKESLRDNMTNMELVLNMLAEVTTTELSKAENPQGFTESQKIAKRGGKIAGNARKNIEAEIGSSVISPLNAHSIITKDIDEKTAEELPELKNTAEEDEAILYEYIKQHGGVSVSIASRIVGGVSKRTVQRRLSDMVDKGLFEIVGATNNLKYVPKAK